MMISLIVVACLCEFCSQTWTEPGGLPGKKLGWTTFFLLCALLAVPGMLLLLKVTPWQEESDKRNSQRTSD